MNTATCPMARLKPFPGVLAQTVLSVVGAEVQLCDASAGKLNPNVDRVPVRQADVTPVAIQAAGTVPAAVSGVSNPASAASGAPPVQRADSRQKSNPPAMLP